MKKQRKKAVKKPTVTPEETKRPKETRVGMQEQKRRLTPEEQEKFDKARIALYDYWKDSENV